MLQKKSYYASIFLFTIFESESILAEHMQTTLSKLESWLKVPGNTKAKLAYLLGYKTSNAISVWISRQKIPRQAELHFLKFIRKEKKK